MAGARGVFADAEIFAVARFEAVLAQRAAGDQRDVGAEARVLPADAAAGVEGRDASGRGGVAALGVHVAAYPGQGGKKRKPREIASLSARFDAAVHGAIGVGAAHHGLAVHLGLAVEGGGLADDRVVQGVLVGGDARLAGGPEELEADLQGVRTLRF